MHHLTPDNLALIQNYEGFVAVPYKYPAKYISVGYGTTNENSPSFEGRGQQPKLMVGFFTQACRHSRIS